jgi:hypothetical protein
LAQEIEIVTSTEACPHAPGYAKQELSSLIIITDSYPAANGGGISQTLYNLFDNWTGTIYVLGRPTDKPPEGPALQATRLTYQFESFRSYGNRWLKRLNTAITRANFNKQQQLKVLPAGWPGPQQAWILLSTTEPIKLHLGWMLQHRFGYTVVPYFMDDWMAGLKLSWKRGNIQQVVAGLLTAAPCWLMISRQLEQILVKRYELERKPCLLVHNPAPLLSPLPDVQAGQRGEVEVAFSIDKLADGPQSPLLGGAKGGLIYAGSIWPMHLDALEAVAKAVHLLNANCQAVPPRRDVEASTQSKPTLRQAHGDNPDYQAEQGQGHCEEGRRSNPSTELLQVITTNEVCKLTIYTSPASWHHNRKHLEGPGVEYGCFIPYADMPAKLQEGWLLLITASFEEKYAPFTNSSVQTKLTDYMAAGKPVLYVGPSVGASGIFVEEHDAGFTIGTSRPEDIAAQLEAIAGMPTQYQRKAANGRQLAAGIFSKPTVQDKLYRFLKEHVPVQR